MKLLHTAKQKTILLLAAAVLLFSLWGYSLNGDESTVGTGESAGSGAQIASAGGMTLTYNSDGRNIILKDTTGYEWNSSVTEEAYDFSKLNDSWKKNVTSLVTIQHTEVKDINPNVKTLFSSEKETKITHSVKDNKLILELAYNVKIAFRLELWFENEALVVRLPKESIAETGKQQLLTVELMPYFGASSEFEEGYMVYPDGSGALKNHKSEASETVRGMAYTWGMYSEPITSLDSLESNRRNGVQNAFLPVYGIKNGNNAFVAYGTEGEAESSVVMHPAGDSIALNRMGFTFHYRSAYNIVLSNIKIKGKDTAENPNGKKYNEALSLADHEVRYQFLSKEQADYSGMAAAYRTYLLDSGALKPTDIDINLSVDLFMGAQENGLFSSSMVAATTISQAEELIQTIRSATGPKSLFTLSGWSKNGYGSYPQVMDTDSLIGSNGKLNKLLETLEGICLKAELFTAGTDNGGYSVGRDVIKAGNQIALTNTQNTRFLFNADTVEDRMAGLQKLKGGYSLENLGRLLYADYNEKAIVNKEDMKLRIQKMLEDVSKERTITVDGANLYTLGAADLVYNLPDTSSEYFITDQSIPFCQMVLYGSIPYTGAAGNLSADFDAKLLKWLEYGYVPFFELTYENADVLKYTDYNSLFTSTYALHEKNIKKAQDTFAEMKNAIGGGYILRHEADGALACVTYDNGVSLLINYAGTDAAYKGSTVKAKSYAIVKGGNAE